jgi:dUTP pyrophosphatase
MYNVAVAALKPDVKYPVKKNPEDAGFDIFSSMDVTIPAGGVRVVSTGLTFEFPPQVRMRVVPRGRQDHLIGSGLIESNYQGELLVKIVNTTPTPLAVKNGDSIGQVIFDINPTIGLVVKDKDEIHLAQSSRGNSGGIVAQFSSQVEPIDDPENF